MHANMQRGIAGLLVAGGMVLGAMKIDLSAADVIREAGQDAGAERIGAVARGVETSAPSDISAAFRRAVNRTLPAVVYIEVRATREADVAVVQPFEGTPWEDFFQPFREQRPEPSPRTGSGSGFIFDERGYILTNNHVVQGAESVSVILQDQREFQAEIVGRDPNTDIAVLKIDGEKLPVLDLGDSDHVEVGEWVLALGYPMHLGATATAGIVSAKGKSLGIIGRNKAASAPLEHFIQTDAAINPGNSGGALINLEGEVVGVNTAIASPTGFYSGYGFAVPVNIARRVARDIMRYGTVHRPKLGVAIADVDPADAEVYGLDSPIGAEVVRVEPDGPADLAGLQLGDVIVASDGEAVETSGELIARLARRDPGDTVTLDVVRYGERLRLTAELGQFRQTVAAEDNEDAGSEDPMGVLGFAADNISPEWARRLGVESDAGVVVAGVTPGGAASRAGLTPGLVIERANGQRIRNINDFRNAVESVEPGDVISLVIRLPEGERTIVNYRTIR